MKSHWSGTGLALLLLAVIGLAGCAGGAPGSASDAAATQAVAGRSGPPAGMPAVRVVSTALSQRLDAMLTASMATPHVTR